MVAQRAPGRRPRRSKGQQQCRAARQGGVGRLRVIVRRPGCWRAGRRCERRRSSPFLRRYRMKDLQQLWLGFLRWLCPRCERRERATADVRSSGCTRGQLTRRRQLAADPCLTYSREAGRAAATGFRMMSTFRILRPRLDASAPRFETPRSRWIDFARAESSRSSSLSDRSQPTASSLLASNQPANDSTPNRLLMQPLGKLKSIKAS